MGSCPIFPELDRLRAADEVVPMGCVRRCEDALAGERGLPLALPVRATLIAIKV